MTKVSFVKTPLCWHFGFTGRMIEFDENNWTAVFDCDYWIRSFITYDAKLYVGTAKKIYAYHGTRTRVEHYWKIPSVILIG